jgi:hypothetical protein
MGAERWDGVETLYLQMDPTLRTSGALKGTHGMLGFSEIPDPFLCNLYPFQERTTLSGEMEAKIPAFMNASNME